MVRRDPPRNLLGRLLVALGATLLVIGFIAPRATADPGGNGQGKNGSPPGEANGLEKRAPEEAVTNTGGANTDGPYSTSSTIAPSPSENGNGQGNATGKPDAGTVGNADDKNPPGQLPGPDDGNAGYECDRNNGIALGNPAHTTCATVTTSTTSTTMSTTSTTTSTTSPTSTPATTPDSVLGREITRPQAEGNALARTGSDVLSLVSLAGLALLAGGVVLTAAHKMS